MDQWTMKPARFSPALRCPYSTDAAARCLLTFRTHAGKERVRVGYTTGWQAASRCESPQAAPGLSLPTGGASSGSHPGRV